MSRKLNLDLEVGEASYYTCYKIKTRQKAIKAIKEYNRIHNIEITHQVLGGGISIKRIA